MTTPALTEVHADAIPIHMVLPTHFSAWRGAQSAWLQQWLNANAVAGQAGELALLPNRDGGLEGVLCLANPQDFWALARLPYSLPPGNYVLAEVFERAALTRLVTGFALGAYRFSRYKASAAKAFAQLGVADVHAREQALRVSGAVCAARDLVNTPAEDLGPEQLARITEGLAQQHGAQFREVVGAQLLEQNFPAIYAVGRASHRAPRLIELNWGSDAHPRLVIVGKGVCFDTGGLDLKPADGMAHMKKDMGGSAVALNLAALVMAEQLPVRLKLLLPAVENAIGPQAYRPGDVLSTRAGISVEIGNTDAEGRVILGDALTYGSEFKPELMIDFATLTGAARIALGPDLPATFSNRDALMVDLLGAAKRSSDPLWAMPLWQEYHRMLDSTIADMNNAGASKHAGAITAALYLQRFVPEALPWIHIDTYCWNDADRPGRPRGGECQSLRAVLQFLRERYSPLTEQKGFTDNSMKQA